jgi:hypothetical protein
MSIATEFPNFPVASIPQLPSDWTDSSWRNDESPSFTANGFQIFLCDEGQFFFVICDAETGETAMLTNSVDACIDFVNAPKTKTIWYLRDVESKGCDFFLWSDEPNAQEIMQNELKETLDQFRDASADEFEVGSAIVSNDYSGEEINS